MINFGLLGLGYFGKNYQRLLQNLKGAILLESASRTQGSIEGVINNSKIDAIAIVTPAETHFELAKKALESGKHVLVEKPMVLNLHEAEELKKVCQKTRKLLMVGHQYLYNDHIRFLKQQLDAGLLGKINSFSVEHYYPGPVTRANILWDAGTHILAMVDFLFDKPAIISASGKGTPDVIKLQASFNNGLLLSYAGERTSPKKTRRMVIVGSEGEARYDEYEDPDKLKIYVGERVLMLKAQTVEPLKNELLHFIDCINKNTAPLTDIEHGLRVTRMLDFIAKKLYS